VTQRHHDPHRDWLEGAILVGMRVRDATAADWAAVWPILLEAGVEGTTLTWDPAMTEDRARTGWMRQPPGQTVVAVTDEGTVVGSAYYRPLHGGPGSHVANAGFVVHSGRRREGIGRALCEHVLDRARADGYRAMVFQSVVETNEPAVRLWRSCGFEIIATVPAAFLHPTDGYVGLHIMHRRLWPVAASAETADPGARSGRWEDHDAGPDR